MCVKCLEWHAYIWAHGLGTNINLSDLLAALTPDVNQLRPLPLARECYKSRSTTFAAFTPEYNMSGACKVEDSHGC